jgi:hypothetical protein
MTGYDPKRTIPANVFPVKSVPRTELTRFLER